MNMDLPKSTWCHILSVTNYEGTEVKAGESREAELGANLENYFTQAIGRTC